MALGLLTLVLDLANSSRMVCGRSGSNLTPCCNKTSQMTTSTIITREGALAGAGSELFIFQVLSTLVWTLNSGRKEIFLLILW